LIRDETGLTYSVARADAFQYDAILLNAIPSALDRPGAWARDRLPSLNRNMDSNLQ
jgi:hypothetical protein